MRHARWTVRGALLALGVVAQATTAAAQSPLTVRTVAHGTWAEAVSELQTDLSSQGRVVQVVVEDGTGQRSPCGTYQLMLDSHGSAAFDAGRCDATTLATPLTLVDRRALFELGGVIARPRQIGIAAVEHRHGSALGGALPAAQTEVHCSIAVRPYVRDLLTGERVRATPEHFEMRLIGQGARVEPHGDGWQVRGGSVTASYELIDRQSGDAVLRETVRLSCGHGAPDATPAGGGVIPLVPRRVFRGATVTREAHDEHGRCGGHEGPEQWYALRLEEAARVTLRLVSDFDATLYVRAGSRDGEEIACHDRFARLETIEMNLEAGVYYVAVDGTGTHGRYRLVYYQDPVEAAALEQGPRGSLEPNRPVRGELLASRSRNAGTCGGRHAPEHVYALRVEQPSFVSVRLSSRFDAALYLLAADGTEVGCRRVLGLPRTVRRAHVRAELRPGLYHVVVDGESGDAGTGRYRVTSLQVPLGRPGRLASAAAR